MSVQGVGPCYAEEAGEKDSGWPALRARPPSYDLPLAASLQLHGRGGATDAIGL